MKTLYCSVHSSKSDFEFMFSKNPGILNVAQKYHSLFANGIFENTRKKNIVLSVPPINIRALFRKTEDSIFFYTPIINIPIIGYLLIWIYLIVFCVIWNVCNLFSRRVIYISATALLKFLPVFLISKLCCANLVLITCDIPYMTFPQRISDMKKEPILLRFRKKMSSSIWFISSYFDYYVFLTNEMNKVVNKRNKPYVVVEGFSDIKMWNIVNNIEDKYEKFIIVYAGGLYKKYGVQDLVDAVESIDNDRVELWLMGKGELEHDLKSNKYKHTKYWGSILNSEVLEIEKRASLLVNPRYSNFQYTEYSFPSKVIEYMASGTLALMTRLKGIPDEYFEHCLVIDNESKEGVKESILKAYSMSIEKRHEIGLSARNFVLNLKNNIIQVKKVLTMLDY